MIIVEPHADDAFLSMGGIIETMRKNAVPVCILTVYSGTRKREADARAYATAVGASWMGLGHTEMGNARVNGPAPFSLDGINLPRGNYYLPLAITHPEHIAVRSAFERAMPERIYYYLDMPYACKLKNQERVIEVLRGRTIVELYKPGLRKYRHIPLFKDQAKFFHFNPIESLAKTFELVVE